MATARVQRKHRKPGPPLKRLPATVEQIETLAGLGLTDEEMALYLGICRTTFHKRKKRSKALREAIRASKIKVDTTVVKSLYSRATDEHDTTAMIFWLKNRQSDRWRDKHDFNGNLHVTAALSMTALKKSLEECGDEKD
jgi:hypothetical protein